ncbi:Uncharacterised protein [Vibrio cholerae]|nr:Uncharacterised protein [Vibrio cholerae]CSI29626.1 Uncharacterised protein [Vibrio cholerae]
MHTVGCQLLQYRIDGSLFCHAVFTKLGRHIQLVVKSFNGRNGFFR